MNKHWIYGIYAFDVYTETQTKKKKKRVWRARIFYISVVVSNASAKTTNYMDQTAANIYKFHNDLVFVGVVGAAVTLD